MVLSFPSFILGSFYGIYFLKEKGFYGDGVFLVLFIFLVLSFLGIILFYSMRKK